MGTAAVVRPDRSDLGQVLAATGVVTVAAVTTLALGSGPGQRWVDLAYLLAVVVFAVTYWLGWDLGWRRSVFWPSVGVIAGAQTISMGSGFYGPGHHVSTLAAVTALTAVGGVSLARYRGVVGSGSLPRRWWVALGVVTLCACVAAAVLSPPYEAPWGAVGPAAVALAALLAAAAQPMDRTTRRPGWVPSPDGVLVLAAVLIYLAMLAVAPYVTTAP